MNKQRLAKIFGVNIITIQKLSQCNKSFNTLYNNLENLEQPKYKREYWFHSKDTAHIGLTTKENMWEKYIMPYRCIILNIIDELDNESMNGVNYDNEVRRKVGFASRMLRQHDKTVDTLKYWSK